MERGKVLAIRERVRGNFDRGAAAYADFEALSGFFDRLTRELLEMAPKLTGMRILDAGCGAGASIAALLAAAGEGGLVAGSDISLGMLKAARQKYPGQPLVLSDARELAQVFKPGFDAVVFNAVLFMVPEIERVVAQARAVLNPGGVLLASVLEDVVLTNSGARVADELALLGNNAGRHAVSKWQDIKSALKSEFGQVETRTLDIEMGEGAFTAFYTQEPMSAGLLPTVAYRERCVTLRDFAGRFSAAGDTATQKWHLALARNPM